MAAKKFRGAPFGTQTARFDVTGVHPKTKVPGSFTQIPYDKYSMMELKTKHKNAVATAMTNIESTVVKNMDFHLQKIKDSLAFAKIELNRIESVKQNSVFRNWCSERNHQDLRIVTNIGPSVCPDNEKRILKHQINHLSDKKSLQFYPWLCALNKCKSHNSNSDEDMEISSQMKEKKKSSTKSTQSKKSENEIEHPSLSSATGSRNTSIAGKENAKENPVETQEEKMDGQSISSSKKNQNVKQSTEEDRRSKSSTRSRSSSVNADESAKRSRAMLVEDHGVEKSPSIRVVQADEGSNTSSARRKLSKPKSSQKESIPGALKGDTEMRSRSGVLSCKKSSVLSCKKSSQMNRLDLERNPSHEKGSKKVSVSSFSGSQITVSVKGTSKASLKSLTSEDNDSSGKTVSDIDKGDDEEDRFSLGGLDSPSKPTGDKEAIAKKSELSSGLPMEQETAESVDRATVEQSKGSITKTRETCDAFLKRKLGPGAYNVIVGGFSPASVEVKASGPGWARQLEVERLAALPHLLHKEQWEENKMLKRKLGPGSYEIKDFIQSADLKPRSGRGICDNLATRFEKGVVSSTPGPGTYGVGGVPQRAMEEKGKVSASTKGILDAGDRKRNLPSVGSHLGPGTYRHKTCTEEMLNKVTSLRGPYELYSGDRNKPISEGYLAAPKLADLGPGQYGIGSFVDEWTGEHKRSKGKFGKIAQYPEVPTERVFLFSKAHYPRDKDFPAPCAYSPQDMSKPQSVNSPGFLSSAKRDDKISQKFFTRNFNPVGAGRYDIQKFDEAQDINGHTSVFKSKTGKPNLQMSKFLQERVRPKDVSQEDRLVLTQPLQRAITVM